MSAISQRALLESLVRIAPASEADASRKLEVALFALCSTSHRMAAEALGALVQLMATDMTMQEPQAALRLLIALTYTTPVPPVAASVARVARQATAAARLPVRTTTISWYNHYGGAKQLLPARIMPPSLCCGLQPMLHVCSHAEVRRSHGLPDRGRLRDLYLCHRRALLIGSCLPLAGTREARKGACDAARRATAL